jgi:hypothetical protein
MLVKVATSNPTRAVVAAALGLAVQIMVANRTSLLVDAQFATALQALALKISQSKGLVGWAALASLKKLVYLMSWVVWAVVPGAVAGAISNPVRHLARRIMIRAPGDDAAATSASVRAASASVRAASASARAASASSTARAASSCRTRSSSVGQCRRHHNDRPLTGRHNRCAAVGR